MNLAPSILGSTAVKHLQQTADAPVLVVGRDRLNRTELAGVGCYNFVAAANLSKVVAGLQVPNLKHLFEHVPPTALALPHMGVISLAVLGAAFEARKIGGASPLESWVTRHANGDGRQTMVTFYTMKAREAAEIAQEKQTLKQRKSARRGQAHKLRLARFGERRASA